MYLQKYKVNTRIGEIEAVRLENAMGAWVEVSQLGAGITGCCVPDRKGFLQNVALGYADMADYMADGPCMGKTPGRYANRIGKGKLEIEGITYSLPVNNGPNHLHGGPEGFQNKLWQVETADDNKVVFTHHSADGEMGYPGNLTVKVTYEWSEDCRLDITLEAVTDRTTVVNLTNHTYWNLRGGDARCALGHKLKINASRYLPTDKDLTPTGELHTVEGTPMDFRCEKEVGQDIKSDFDALRFGKGYDACWALDKKDGEFAEAVVLSDEISGRRLTVGTDQPGVQIYTGNWLAGSPANRDGRSYEDYEGIAIEAQGFPDAPNRPSFPTQELKPGETYRRKITYTFSTI